MFHGSIVALVTPMNPDGSIDFARYLKLLEFHINNNSDGVVVIGTTGEAPTIDFDEHVTLIKEAVNFVDGQIPVIAGTGANSTKEAIFLTEQAKKIGADACLLVTPYYNKPNQKGLYEHYKAINDAVDIPQILYNVPSRTGCDLANETIIQLSHLKNIVGVKDATGDLNRIDVIKNSVDKRFALISGDDLSFVDYLKKGGNAVISVTANLVPKQMHLICEEIQKYNYSEAETLNQKLQALHEMMFVEPNPIPVKWALSYLGMINGKLRLPMVELDKIYQVNLAKLLKTIK
jgi:4-hydroxy-tetrahydrodipicolinate synthase